MSAAPTWGVWQERTTIDADGVVKREAQWARGTDGYHLIFKTQAEAERTAGLWNATAKGTWRYTARQRD